MKAMGSHIRQSAVIVSLKEMLAKVKRGEGLQAGFVSFSEAGMK